MAQGREAVPGGSGQPRTSALPGPDGPMEASRPVIQDPRFDL